jgi:hypothetical protein
MTTFKEYDKCLELMKLLAENGFSIVTDQFDQRLISADVHHVNWRDYGFVVGNEWTLVESVDEAITFINGVMVMKQFEELREKNEN